MTANKRYVRSFIPAMIAYIVLLILSITLLRTMDASSPLRIPVAVLPVLPVLFGLYGFIRFLRECDEMIRRIHFEAFGFSIAATSVVTFTLGFLENAGIQPPGLIWVFPMLIAFWGVGVCIANWRYR